MPTSAITDTIQKSEIIRIFEAQKAQQYVVASTSLKVRKAKLKALKKAVMTTYRQRLREALRADMGKSVEEVDLIEVYAVVKEIRHALSNLRRWTGKQYVPTPIALVGSSSYIQYEPKGVCLIISPWNFPLSLTFGPLASAMAAGNTVVIKPSEHTPHTSRLMAQIVAELFPPEEVSVFEGAIETATELLKLPFNHIFFTGSPAVGKIVMEAAAKNLASVTLELGGKSPTIIDETADIARAAARTAWGKWINGGQICIAPDYVYVHESRSEAFIQELKKTLDRFFGPDATQSPDYTHIVNGRHLRRVQEHLADSVSKGARVVYGGKVDEANKAMAPTLVRDVPLDSALMQEEIFGPVLSVLTYSNLDTVLEHIRTGEKPLALYIYSNSKQHIARISRDTRAGTTCINHNGPQFFHAHLPFGGSNNSGIGKSHGFYGFQAFSNARAYYRQHLPGPLELLMPPYRKWKARLIDWTIRYF